ncbi:aminotransferase class I/II-fold pyridoxal phosphate-dependent enzyme [Aquisalibacillus elongatus]|uniref:Cystathionine beta-lyase family protein involved in aluminum resistance n=1 Tax=Aquisalibacillus elongatus TaxID=485577 RepID=A0A3N5C8N6_9BACI|nr:methionine gamma-lyase family protein [Aquisalibacillus elongatus]RPF55912.1 cystathionine beta-lyase family protein involved in aluminum resistance [Aquisalibacillus elongatus]
MFNQMIEIEHKIENELSDVSKTVTYNQQKVLNAFRKLNVGDHHFNPTTGYGYDDMGREKLEELYAQVFNSEDALVRPQIVSGTHAITTALFGNLRPGEELLYITGRPYDTLESVIGIKERVDGDGSLRDFGIGYQEVALKVNGGVDFNGIEEALNPNIKIVAIQRSKGYDNRPSFSIEDIKEMVDFIKAINNDLIIFVDNCYGEFVERKEPTDVGADLIAGSLIKNPGAGIVKTGGYIVGKKDLIHKCANFLVAPGLGKETGASLNSLQEMYQGLFLAPHVVGEALKGAIYTSQLLNDFGYTTTPGPSESRTDLIQSITFIHKEEMVRFAQTVQEQSPINSHVKPYPSYMPGYDHDVIMAAGTFIQGASLELTADGPIREPYTLYVQGGLTYEHVKIAITEGVLQLQKEIQKR